MTKINDLSLGNLDQIRQQQHRDQYATPLNGASVGSGGMRFYNEGQLRVENDGGLVVVGSAEIIGRMIGSGTLDWSGIVNISGPLVVQDGGSVTIGSIEFLPDGSASFNTLTIGPDGTLETGSAKINPDGSADFGEFSIAANGDLVSKGTLDIEGNATLKADLDVTTGKIKAGSMTIDPDLFGGSVQFTAGGYLSGTASGPQLTGPSGNSFVFTRSGLAGIQAAKIELVGTTEVQGSLKVTAPGSISGVEPNVYFDGNGQLRKITT